MLALMMILKLLKLIFYKKCKILLHIKTPNQIRIMLIYLFEGKVITSVHAVPNKLRINIIFKVFKIELVFILSLKKPPKTNPKVGLDIIKTA